MERGDRRQRRPTAADRATDNSTSNTPPRIAHHTLAAHAATYGSRGARSCLPLQPAAATDSSTPPHTHTTHRSLTRQSHFPQPQSL